MSPRILGSLLWEGNDPDRAREIAKAFRLIGIATDITPGISTYFRIWRLVPIDSGYAKWRNGLMAVRT